MAILPKGLHQVGVSWKTLIYLPAGNSPARMHTSSAVLGAVRSISRLTGCRVCLLNEAGTHVELSQIVMVGNYMVP